MSPSLATGLESRHPWNFPHPETKRDGLIELFMTFWDSKKTISTRNIKHVGAVAVYLSLLKIRC